MKILIVRTFPNVINPDSYNVQEIGLAKALTRKNQECGIVFYNGNQPDIIEKIDVDCEDGKKEITVYRLKSYNFLKNGFFPSLKKIAKEYDVIQVHEYDQITSWLFYAWSRKKVVIYHGPYYHSFNKGYNLKCKIFDHTFLWLKNKPEVLSFTKSNAAADFLKQKGFQNVIPVGVGLDTEVFSEFELKEDKSKQDVRKGNTFTWIYVGKLEPRRNTLFLLEIMKELSKRYSDMRFIIVGNGEADYKKACIDRMIPLMNERKLTYIEAASQEGLKALYKTADAMLFPSLYEIFGMVLMEAIYFELPVITSANGGADTLFRNGENSMIVDDFIIDNWMEAAERLYKDKDLYQKIKNNLHLDKDKRLSWDTVAEKMLRAYAEFGL